MYHANHPNNPQGNQGYASKELKLIRTDVNKGTRMKNREKHKYICLSFVFKSACLFY